MAAAADRLLRPLGTFEKMYPARQILGIYNSVVVTASLALPSTPEKSAAAVYSLFANAIPALLTRHPCLCGYVAGERTAAPTFQRLESVKVEDVLEMIDIRDEDDLARKLGELHDRTWSFGPTPLWKLVVLRETVGGRIHAAFVYNHVIGDGLSGAAFHRYLLQQLADAKPSGEKLVEANTTIPISPSTRFLEPVEKLMKFPLSWTFLIKQVAQQFAPQWLVGRSAPVWAGLPMKTLDQCPFVSHVRIITLPAAKLKTILKKAKEHSVALTSVISALIVFTLANVETEAPAFRGTTPYALRGWTGTSLDDMVNQVSAVQTIYPGELLSRVRNAADAASRSDVFWSIAANFQAQMKDELAQCPQDNVVGLLPFVSDFVQFYQKKFDKPRENTFEVSNLGVFKPGETPLPAGWSLESMIFTQGAQTLGPALTAGCVSVAGGALTISLTWQEAVIGEELVGVVARAFAELPETLQ